MPHVARAQAIRRFGIVAHDTTMSSKVLRQHFVKFKADLSEEQNANINQLLAQLETYDLAILEARGKQKTIYSVLSKISTEITTAKGKRKK